jgi:tight adherence protein B
VLITNSLKAGLNLIRSFEMVADGVRGPVGTEFAAVVRDVGLGRSLEDALLAFAERVPVSDVEIFVQSVLVLGETGGNLVETFETLVSTMRERRAIADKVRSLTMEARMQGVVISLIPPALVVVFLVFAPDFILPLVTTWPGLCMLGVATALLTVGWFLMKRFSKVSV